VLTSSKVHPHVDHSIDQSGHLFRECPKSRRLSSLIDVRYPMTDRVTDVTLSQRSTIPLPVRTVRTGNGSRLEDKIRQSLLATSCSLSDCCSLCAVFLDHVDILLLCHNIVIRQVLYSTVL
jgi:hypothetical protein